MISGFLLDQANFSTLEVYGVYFKQIFSAHEARMNVDCFFKDLGSSVSITNPLLLKIYINNCRASQDKYLDYSCLSIIFFKVMSIYCLMVANSLGTVFAN